MQNYDEIDVLFKASTLATKKGQFSKQWKSKRKSLKKYLKTKDQQGILERKSEITIDNPILQRTFGKNKKNRARLTVLESS